MRELTEEEREVLQAGLRSSSAFTVRRCQILLTSAEGRLKPREIAERLRCSDQFVRNAIRPFHREGLACLREMIRQSPRAFGQETGVWAPDLLVEVIRAEGLRTWRNRCRPSTPPLAGGTGTGPQGQNRPASSMAGASPLSMLLPC